MARVFITGSADGLGRMAAELLIEQDHTVVLHARSVDRAAEIRKTFFGAEEIVVGDLSSIKRRLWRTRSTASAASTP
jgi:NAD(P)-dependent dehydrogenase (short-subunit alcohol dehydrogenase family)